MVTFHRASTGDTIRVPEALAAKYDARPEWERVADKKKEPKA